MVKDIDKDIIFRGIEVDINDIAKKCIDGDLDGAEVLIEKTLDLIARALKVDRSLLPPS
jgi:hypothetical protein